MSEFDRIDMMKKGEAPQTPPSAPSVPTPPPVMLHETSKSKAQSPEFQIKTGTEDQMVSKPAGMSLPTKPAVLELGNIPTPSPSTAKVVHYSEYKTPEA